ncbi:PucR family transcriptional regulator [Tuberibacillus sp. Marseille-P3662]|uniref:PucR family transcriptional regulator n=1 Tax=Tuberibacillus sp. Marseille-P3662 TaxID=1965358 RepID=UPI000A1C800F|nr:PucR family transcriptional regulator [Tuberibacillus sp. Marseille-P3662]
MKSTLILKVSDILQRDHFGDAQVVAGRKGLSRAVKWTHIMEVTEIGQLLNGNELILSTGVGWANEDLSLSFLRQLIDQNVSALCVELGTYINSIPEGMIELAKQHQFPLIVFNQEVRFIDITQDLNGLMIKTRDKMMSDLEAFSNQLNHLLLSTDGFKGVLRLLHDYLDVQVIYEPVDSQVLFYPTVEKSKRETLLSKIHSRSHDLSESTASQPIQALGHKFADLIIFSQSEAWTEFDYLVLDRTATALAQDQLRLLYVEEKRKYKENRWVQKWLNGDHRQEEIEQHLSSLESSLKPKGCTVCLCKVDFSEREPDFTYYTMIFRSIFEQQGFFLLATYEWNQMTFVLLNKRKKADWKSRMNRALEQIQKTELIKEQLATPAYFGVGKLLDHLNCLHESYHMAQETLYAQEKIGKLDNPYYEELYIYQLVSQLNKQGSLEAFVTDYLSPVLEYDDKHKSQMFDTLKVFLEVNGSKKEAAKRLFIVRQTLYHRIEKLKELLGEDFMEPEKRLAIEFGVYAKGFLYEQT